MRHDVAFFFSFLLHSVVNVQVTHSKWSHLVDARAELQPHHSYGDIQKDTQRKTKGNEFKSEQGQIF